MVSHHNTESAFADESTSTSMPSEAYLVDENNNTVDVSRLLQVPKKHSDDIMSQQEKPSLSPSSSLSSSSSSSSWLTGSLLHLPTTLSSSTVSSQRRPQPMKGILRGVTMSTTTTKNINGHSCTIRIIQQTWELISDESSLWIMIVLPVVTLCGDQMAPFLSPWSRTLLLSAIIVFCVGNWSWSIYNYCVPQSPINTDGTISTKRSDHRTDTTRSTLCLLTDMYSPQARERIRRVRFDDQTKLHIIPRKEKDGIVRDVKPTTRLNRWSNSSTDGRCRVPTRDYGSEQNTIQMGQTLSLMRRHTSVTNGTKILIPTVKNDDMETDSQKQPLLMPILPSRTCCEESSISDAVEPIPCHEDSSTPELAAPTPDNQDSSMPEPAAPTSTLRDQDSSSDLDPTQPSFPEVETVHPPYDAFSSKSPERTSFEYVTSGIQGSSETDTDAMADDRDSMDSIQPMELDCHEDNLLISRQQITFDDGSIDGVRQNMETDSDDGFIPMDPIQPIKPIDGEIVDVATDKEQPGCSHFVDDSESDESQDACASFSPLEECPSDEWVRPIIQSDQASGLQSIPSEQASRLQSVPSEYGSTGVEPQPSEQALVLKSQPSEQDSVQELIPSEQASVLEESAPSENENPHNEPAGVHKMNQRPFKDADEGGKTTMKFINTSSSFDVDEQIAVLSPFATRQNCSLPLRATNRTNI